MDAGRVYFEDGTMLDTSKSMSFKNLDRPVALLSVGACLRHSSSRQPVHVYVFWGATLCIVFVRLFDSCHGCTMGYLGISMRGSEPLENSPTSII